jgi:hypothetical protein
MDQGRLAIKFWEQHKDRENVQNTQNRGFTFVQCNITILLLLYIYMLT